MEIRRLPHHLVASKVTVIVMKDSNSKDINFRQFQKRKSLFSAYRIKRNGKCLFVNFYPTYAILTLRAKNKEGKWYTQNKFVLSNNDISFLVGLLVKRILGTL